MQETGVRGEPIYEGHLPWFTKVFVLYLAPVLFMSVLRAISLMRRLRRLPKAQKEAPTHQGSASSRTSSRPEGAGGGFQALWEFCYIKLALIKNLSLLTFLLSLLLFAWSTTRILQGAAVQKVTGSAFLADAMAEVLTTFSLGIIVCAVLYAFAIFYEAVLARRKVEIDHP
jgi:hypothetical protein